MVSLRGVLDDHPFVGLTNTYASPALSVSNAAPMTAVSPALSTAAANPKPPFVFASEFRSLADSTTGSEALAQPPEAVGSRKYTPRPQKTWLQTIRQRPSYHRR